MNGKRYVYRCCRCRVRNTFKRPVEDYIVARKCRCCGKNRFYLDKERMRPRATCNCTGYHFKHRLGSGCCVANPMSLLRQAERGGADRVALTEIKEDLAWRGITAQKMGSNEPCPF